MFEVLPGTGIIWEAPYNSFSRLSRLLARRGGSHLEYSKRGGIEEDVEEWVETPPGQIQKLLKALCERGQEAGGIHIE